MKTQRLNKRTRVNSKAIAKIETVKDYPDTLVGRTVILRSLPANVKKAKRLFEVGKKYKIQKPVNNFVNTLMAVNIKGKDNNIYYVQFPHWKLTAN